MKPPKTLYAHVAIPKTATTTVVHVLRRNFFMRYLEVRPFFQSSNKKFTARDFRASLRLNPAIECISGHTVHAFSDLETVVEDIKYFTALRDPVERCISAYFFGTEKRNRQFTFEQHLRTERKNNIQTKWIAGTDDLDAAKQILTEQFWLVGRTERLAELMLFLRSELADRQFDPMFQSKNLRSARRRSAVGRTETPESIMRRYGEEIIDRNRVDIALLEYVENKIVPRQIARYGPTFADDLAAFVSLSQERRPMGLRPYVDYAMRKAYYDPVIGLIRLFNGLSYGERI